MYNENNEFYLGARDKAILQKCVYENPYIPFKPFVKQAEMILATEKEVLIGGAAGGSKSTSLLMRALFYVQDDVNELPFGKVHECSVPSHFGLIAGSL